MITVCTNHQHLLMQSHKVWPKDNFVLKEQMESSNLPFLFNTNYIAIAFQKKNKFLCHNILFNFRWVTP